ncbi:MAG: hypothetical protein MHPSP_000930, partial [Paramarteilia canceri]
MVNYPKFLDGYNKHFIELPDIKIDSSSSKLIKAIHEFTFMYKKFLKCNLLFSWAYLPLLTINPKLEKYISLTKNMLKKSIFISNVLKELVKRLNRLYSTKRNSSDKYIAELSDKFSLIMNWYFSGPSSRIFLSDYAFVVVHWQELNSKIGKDTMGEKNSINQSLLEYFNRDDVTGEKDFTSSKIDFEGFMGHTDTLVVSIVKIYEKYNLRQNFGQKYEVAKKYLKLQMQKASNNWELLELQNQLRKSNWQISWLPECYSYINLEYFDAEVKSKDTVYIREEGLGTKTKIFLILTRRALVMPTIYSDSVENKILYWKSFDMTTKSDIVRVLPILPLENCHFTRNDSTTMFIAITSLLNPIMLKVIFHSESQLTKWEKEAKELQNHERQEVKNAKDQPSLIDIIKLQCDKEYKMTDRDMHDFIINLHLLNKSNINELNDLYVTEKLINDYSDSQQLIALNIFIEFILGTSFKNKKE